MRKKAPKKSGTPSDEDIRVKIISALNNEKFFARTITGIANEAHINKAIVITVIKNDNEIKKLIKIYPRKSENGKVLFTTKERFSEKAPMKDKFIDFFATKRMTIDDAI